MGFRRDLSYLAIAPKPIMNTSRQSVSVKKFATAQTRDKQNENPKPTDSNTAGNLLDLHKRYNDVSKNGSTTG